MCIATCVNGLLVYNYRCNNLEAKFSTVQQVKLEDNFHQMKLCGAFATAAAAACFLFTSAVAKTTDRPTGPVIKYAVFTI